MYFLEQIFKIFPKNNKCRKIFEKGLTKRNLWFIIIYENKADTICGSPFDPTQSNAETVNMLFSRYGRIMFTCAWGSNVVVSADECPHSFLF